MLIDEVERDSMPCTMARMGGKNDNPLTVKQLKRINKLSKGLKERVMAEGKSIIRIDAFTWMIEH